MSAFYGVVKGQARTKATRRGSPASGIETWAAGWDGAVHVELEQSAGRSWAIVTLRPWGSDAGRSVQVFQGYIDEPARRALHLAAPEATRLDGAA